MNKEEMWLLKEKHEGVESEAFHADCERLAAGEPLGYVIGHVPFLDCQIWLDSHPLIPRPETEYWTEQAIDEIKKLSSNSRGRTPQILDLCAGSGAIGVAVARAIPKAHVSFAELDPVHLPTIKKNIIKNLSIDEKVLCEQFSVVLSDVFENTSGSFDFILTNPPYIDHKANTVEESVTAHEPHIALFGGEKGMEVIERIIAGARASLVPLSPTNPGGQLWIEHEPFQADTLHLLAKQYDFTITTHQDQYNTPRYSVLTMAK